MNQIIQAPLIRVLTLQALVAAFTPLPLRGLTLELQRRDPSRAVTTPDRTWTPKHRGRDRRGCLELSPVQDGDHARRCHRAAHEQGPRRRPRARHDHVMLCPSDVVDNYAGYPQRDFSLRAAEVYPCPSVVNVTCPPVPDAGGCACSRRALRGDLRLGHAHLRRCASADADLMPDTQAEGHHAICQKFGLTHLIYVRVPHPGLPARQRRWD